MKTAEQILNAKKCGDVFEENTVVKIKAEFKQLVKIYHPDVYKSSNANEVMSKLNYFYKRALELVKDGNWEYSDKILIESKTGKKIILRYLSEKYFELGKFYIGRKHIIYLLSKDNKKYYNNALKIVSNLKYANDKMKIEFERYFPKIVEHFETNKNEWCIVIEKNEDMFLLEDLLRQQNGKLDQKHVAWIMSRLSNIACYFQYAGLVHNGISLNNCYVSPKTHTIYLLGGWWYTTNINEKMIGTQRAIFSIMALKDKEDKISNYRTDLESIKLIGKQLLNDMSLIPKKGESQSLPEPFKNWLKKGASDNAREEFKLWHGALDQSYGKRTFITLDVSEKDIYKE